MGPRDGRYPTMQNEDDGVKGYEFKNKQFERCKSSPKGIERLETYK